MANYRTNVVCRQCGVRAPREKAHLYFEMTTEGSWRHYCEACRAKITHVSCTCGKTVLGWTDLPDAMECIKDLLLAAQEQCG